MICHILHFICPPNMLFHVKYFIHQVTCGPYGKGYTISLPTDLLKSIAPALKWGLLLLKVALATQGKLKNSFLHSSPLLTSTISN